MAKAVIKNANSETALGKIENNSIDGVVTDPPYNIGYANHDWDTKNSLTAVWTECFRTLKPGGYLVAFGDHKRFHHTIIELEKIGFELISNMNWKYPNGTPACQPIDENHHTRVKPAHEPFGVFIKPILEETYKLQRQIHGNSGLRIKETVPGVTMTTSVLEYNKPTPTERCLGVEHLDAKQVSARKESERALQKTASRANNHPCVKPVALMSHICRLIAKPGDVILDPFMGSGATGMAAVWNGMNFVGIELDSNYCEIAKLRVEYALNNEMPLFPLRAPERRKLAKTEKTVSNFASAKASWLSAEQCLSALLPSKVPTMSPPQKVLSESREHPNHFGAPSNNLEAINPEENVALRCARSSNISAHGRSTSNRTKSHTSLQARALNKLVVRPALPTQSNRTPGQLTMPSLDIFVRLRPQKELSRLNRHQLRHALYCFANRENAAFHRPQQSPQSLQTLLHALRHNLLALSALARSPPSDDHAGRQYLHELSRLHPL